MSEWYWTVIALKAAFFLSWFAHPLFAEDGVQKLPFCDPEKTNEVTAVDDIILVSTLDGKLTAFSTNNGAKAWDLETQPLLSSNLHHVELTSGGKWVRLVPSLRGTLYSLSGETVEPLPFTTEQLLSSTFKYSDDLVIAGSRETEWMGVDSSNGDIIYECTSHGCNGEKEGYGRTLLAVRRHASTVRALDPKSGEEKWNFSVAQYNVALSHNNECQQKVEKTKLEYTVKVAPEGGLAVCQSGSPVAMWKQKLSSPVAGLWRINGGSLEAIDVLWAATKALSHENFVQNTPPALYIGVHNTQLYIQEGENYVNRMDTAVSNPRTPWKIKISRPLINGGEETTALQNADPNSLSLVTLYGDTGQGNHGFFLYQEETCDQAVQVTENQLNELLEPDRTGENRDESENRVEHHHVHVHVYSLWFWWKEVLLIVISSTLLMNLMIWPRFFAPKVPVLPMPLNKEYIVVEKHYDRPIGNEYSGRYENDFTPLRCLGRGGFGVVFEARNNIDHCSYAVKRITLPRRQSKRERVLREVRALAKLEHEHIVRYFNAWLEEPPANWQEERDAQWMRELDGVSVEMTEDVTSHKSKLKSSRPITSKGVDSNSLVMNLQKNELLDFDGVLSEPSKRHRSFSCNDSFSVVFDENTSNKTKNSLYQTTEATNQSVAATNAKVATEEDSYIVFANSEHYSNSEHYANSEDVNHNSKGLSEARNHSISVHAGGDAAFKKKKKGHTRHWSLDMCVRSQSEEVQSPIGSKMYLYIQMQLCLRDSLHDWLRQNRSFEARGEKVKTLFSQIVSAVEYVHLAGLIHRDLKPSNIFFAPDGKVKVGDFGLVTAMSDSSQDGEELPNGFDLRTRHTYRVGTHLYMSPEQLRGHPYSYKVDIYSLGLILFELLQPFGTEAERVGCLLKLREGVYPNQFKSYHPNEMEVLQMMLSEEPSKRPTASGVKARAPLFQDTDHKWHFNLPNMAAS